MDEDPKLEVFLALRQLVLCSHDYQPYKKPRPCEEMQRVMSEGKYQDVMAIMKREGVSLFLSPMAHCCLSHVYKLLGETELEQQSFQLTKLCADAIEQSGDGSLDHRTELFTSTTNTTCSIDTISLTGQSHLRSSSTRGVRWMCSLSRTVGSSPSM